MSTWFQQWRRPPPLWSHYFDATGNPVYIHVCGFRISNAHVKCLEYLDMEASRLVLIMHYVIIMHNMYTVRYCQLVYLHIIISVDCSFMLRRNMFHRNRNAYSNSKDMHKCPYLSNLSYNYFIIMSNYAYPYLKFHNHIGYIYTNNPALCAVSHRRL